MPTPIWTGAGAGMVLTAAAETRGRDKEEVAVSRRDHGANERKSRENMGEVRDSSQRDQPAKDRSTKAVRRVKALRSASNQPKPPADLQLLTQNLQGFAKETKRITAWFDGFRRLHAARPLDAILVQETRATERWASTLEARYARSWGYDPTKMESPLSYWTTTPTAAAGVAILLHPTSAFQNVTPLWEDEWNEHFMALQGEVDGHLATLVCVYGPTDTTRRETLFADMAKLGKPRGLVYVGGDFNCTLNPELDRSRQSKATHYSPALSHLLEAWGLVDGVATEMLEAETAQEVAAFRTRHHTYTYGLADGDFRDVTTRQMPVCHSDHEAVILQMTRKRPKVSHARRRGGLKYPLPVCAADAMHECGRRMLEEYGTALATMEAGAAADQWDDLKTRIRRETLKVQRTRRAAATLRYRTRIRRLNAALQQAKARVSGARSAPGTTLEAITDGVEALTLDAHARVKSLRRELILVKMRGTTRRARMRYTNYAGPATVTTRACYRRISMKFSRRGTASLPPEPGTHMSDAERLARDWRPIVQQPPCDAAKQDLLFASLPVRSRIPDYGAMATPFTEEEVAAAIERCPRGKAAGPDGIPNDWYRVMATPLAEVLAPLFSAWYADGCLPPSFQGATIFCLPKLAKPRTGLDYRPIALLNSDYKIYARVLLNRVREYVPDLVSPTQFGFVPGRQVHDAIDVWQAVQARVAQGAAPPQTAAILLDFAKAYDTLDRRFLRLALRRHGFPAAFVTAVDTMHLATTAQYLAEGHLSTTQSITTGIRQGCPLAPTLFILAVDVLYEMVAAAPDIHGVGLGGQVRVALVGFADDTTGYVTTALEALALKKVLAEFAEAAGLKVNIAKSRAVYAGQSSGHRNQAIGFPTTRAEELFRYLGAMIASTPSPGHVWNITLQQMTTRLYLAAVKTTNVLQRIQICRAVIIPKILYVARHCWPDRDQISRLQQYVHDYAWHGVLTHERVKGRAWMGVEEAAARSADGGLQLPCVRQELLLLSARTVQHWMGAESDVSRAVGAQLLQGLLAGPDGDLWLVPGRGHGTKLTRKATMAATGVNVLQHVLSCPVDATELQHSQSLRETAGVGSSATHTWEDGWLHRDYSRNHEQLTRLRLYQEKHHGALYTHGLWRTQLFGAGLLFLADGTHAKEAHFPGLVTRDLRVMDVVQCEWVAQDRLRFRYCLSPSQPGHQAAKSFRKLCDLLVFSYPALLLRQDEQYILRARPDTDIIWRLRQHGKTLHLTCDRGPGEEDLGPIRTLIAAQRLARRATSGAQVRFDPHPALSGVLPLWGAATRLYGKKLRAVVTRDSRMRAAVAEEKIRKRAREQHAPIAEAMERLPWKAIHGLPYGSSRQRVCLLRIKGLRFTGYDKGRDARGCPHCPRIGSRGGQVSHMMWECPKAKILWKTVLDFWQQQGLWPTSDPTPSLAFLRAVFSLKLPAVPPRTWNLPILAKLSLTDHRAMAEVYPTLQAAWQQHVLTTFLVIKQWRDGIHDDDTAWTEAQASAAHAAAIRQALRQLSHTLETREHRRHPGPRILTDLLRWMTE